MIPPGWMLGRAAARTATGSGEGGRLSDAAEQAYKFIFEYVSNRYSVPEDNLRKADAVEIKVGLTWDDLKRKVAELREISGGRLENFLRVSTEELKDFARLTGREDVHQLSVEDLCTMSSEISEHTDIEHI